MLRTYAGPLVWRTERSFPFWAAPAGTVGWVDLAPVPQQAQAGGTPRNALFVTSEPLPSEYALLGEGDPREVRVSAKQRAAWRSLLGFTPQGETLADLVWDHLTRGADPSGDAGPKPLMPGRNLALELYLHKRVRGESFRWGQDPEATARVRMMLRREFRGLMAEAGAGRLKDRQHHRRVLDFWCEQYGVADWREFVPADLQAEVPGRLPHETTLTDNFTRADADPLGTSSEGWSWVEQAGDWDIISNRAAPRNGPDVAYANSALSSADHYGQITVATFGGGPVGPTCRHTTSTGTYYTLWEWDTFNEFQLYKSTAGTAVAMGTIYTLDAYAGMVMKIEANGSAIRGYEGGVQRVSVTDTGITSNLYCGIYANHTSHRLSQFTAADLGGGASAVPVMMAYYRRLRNA